MDGPVSLVPVFEKKNASGKEVRAKMEGYRVLDLVGEGSFGKVYKARKKHSAQVTAMKFITKKGKSEKDVDGLRQEIEILKNLKHENIIGMLDAFETPSEFCVVTEFAHGELFDVLQHDRRLSEDQVKKIARQLVKALHYLHSRRIIHRDMKPQNILIGTGGLVKLCDFGFASAMSPSTLMLHSIKGTPLYMAPELVQEQAYNHNVDLWSLGVILYELYFGVPPFYTNSIYKLINQIVKSPVEFQQPISSEFENFLSGLLHKVPGERLSWPELLHHPFVQETEQEKLVNSPNPSVSLGSNDRDALLGQSFAVQDGATCSPPVENSSACHTATQSGLNNSSNQQPNSVHMDSNSKGNSLNTLKEKNGDESNLRTFEKKPEVSPASESLDSYSGQGVTSGDLSGSDRQTCSRMSACSSEVATSDGSKFQALHNRISPSGLEGLGSWLACVMDGCKAELEIPAMGSVLPKVEVALACIQEHSEIDLTALILALLDLVCTLSYSDEVSGSRVRTVRFALGSLVCLLDNSRKETMETFVYGEAGNRLLLMAAGTAKKLRSRSASPSDGATASLNSVLRTASSLLMRLSVESQDLVGQMVSPDSPAANPDHARSLLHGSNSPQVLGDILLVYSQLGRMDAAMASIFSEADLPLYLHGLLCHRSPIVRGRAAHLIGNLCRHSPLYYQQLVRPFARSGHGTSLQAGTTREQSKEKPVGYRSEPATLMSVLIDLLRDEDGATRKFASFALGNAAFHNQTLYVNLADAIAPLIDLLLRDDVDKEGGKARANAAGALGNFVRNGMVLCDRLVTSGALDALNAVAFRDGDCAAPVALFSLGNMAAYEVCRYKMHSLEIDKKAAVLSRTGQGNVAKYAARILSKYTGRSKR